MFCPNCGTQIPDESKFCPSCGAPLGRSQQVQTPASSPEPVPQTPVSQPVSTSQKKQVKTVKIGKCAIPSFVVLLIVALLLRLAITVMKKSSETTESPAITQPSTSSQTLEDMLRESGTLDEFTGQLQQEFAQSDDPEVVKYREMYDVKSASMDITGNMITATLVSNVASTDPGSANLVSAFQSDLSDESGIEETAETIKELEQQFGIEGVQWSEVYLCSDGVTFASALYDDSGLVDYDVAEVQ